METWGAEGQMNPFQDIYDLVFQMTVRMASCEELVADTKSVQKMSDLFWKLEKSATPMSPLSMVPRYREEERETSGQGPVRHAVPLCGRQT